MGTSEYTSCESRTKCHRTECHQQWNLFYFLLMSLPRQALIWEPEDFRRRPGRPRQNWKDVVKKDLRKTGISWDEVEEAAEDSRSCRNSVTQCVFHVGWTTRKRDDRQSLDKSPCTTSSQVTEHVYSSAFRHPGTYPKKNPWVFWVNPPIKPTSANSKTFYSIYCSWSF